MAVYNRINGNLTYNSANVPVYDEKKKVGHTAKIYIILSTQQETPTESNDCTWITLSTIDIEVIARTEFEVSKDMIDDIADDIQDLLLPTKFTEGYSVPSGFEFANPRFTNTITQTLQISETESILRKILKFEVQIVEQQ